MNCNNPNCGEQVIPHKFAANKKFCSDACCNLIKNKRNRPANRARQKAKAVELGISTKQHMARFASNRWGYATEVVRRRCKKSGTECTIKPMDLKRLFEQQKGLCPLTGWQMLERKSGTGYSDRVFTVDRIDHTKGYVKGNIRLVCFIANNAKYTYNDDQLYDFCKAVVEQREQTCCQNF